MMLGAVWQNPIEKIANTYLIETKAKQIPVIAINCDEIDQVWWRIKTKHEFYKILSFNENVGNFNFDVYDSHYFIVDGDFYDLHYNQLSNYHVVEKKMKFQVHMRRKIIYNSIKVFLGKKLSEQEFKYYILLRSTTR